MNKIEYHNNMCIIYEEIWAPEGIVIIDEKLIKLLQSNAINNLKNVGQYGAANYFVNNLGMKKKTTRYDHSIGAMILTLKLGGSIENIIVALLHDTIHTAFSHTIDFLTQNEEKSYHEEHKKDILQKNSEEFQQILGKNWHEFFNEQNYPLIKLNNPFAIDIADYTARDGVQYEFCSVEEANQQLELLIIKDNILCCKSEKSKKWWVDLSRKVNDLIYTSPWNIAMNHYFAMELKEKINSKLISFDELKYPNADTEYKIFILVKQNIDALFLDKEWYLLDENSYSSSTYIFIKKMKLRSRYVNPPINDKPIKSEDIYFTKDLVMVI